MSHFKCVLALAVKAVSLWVLQQQTQTKTLRHSIEQISDFYSQINHQSRQSSFELFSVFNLFYDQITDKNAI